MTPDATQSPTPAREREAPLERVLVRVAGERPGPITVFIAAIHGNEPAGVEALKRFWDTFEARRIPLRGELVGLTGNLSALARRRRYIAKDLNRLWLPERLAALEARTNSGRPQAEPLHAEDREQLELLNELQSIFRGGSETFVLLLHTTSGRSAPFITLRDDPRNRSFAVHFGVPLVLGLDAHLDGTLEEYLSRAGHAAIAFEGGQQDDAEAVDNVEAAIWTALAAAENIEPSTPEVLRSWERFAEIGRSLPPVVEVLYRHPVEIDDRFQMEPGFVNFQPLAPGQVLARDREGLIRSQWHGRILMPLYQELGEDGFFVVRELK